MSYKIILSLLLVVAAAPAQAQSKLSPQARHIVASASANVDAVATRAHDARQVSAYVTLEPDADVQAIERLGVRVGLRHGNLLTARIPVDVLADVAALPGVAYVQTAVAAAPMMDLARSEGRADLVEQGTDLPQSFTGNGVVVGIIDSGFDYTHPNFYDAERSELRIKRVWEQGYDGGTAPEAFGYGTELATAEAILAAGGDVTTNSHGTHVAGIAIGADRSLGDYHGIAPDADIVLVSISGADTETNVNISDAIAYIYDYADAVGKPCVVNMSLGTQTGPHDGTSTFDILADEMQGPGRLLVGSVGNFGGGNFHASKTFQGVVADTLRTFVDFKNGLSTSTAGGVIDIWGEPGMQLQVNVFTYRTYVGTVVDSVSIVLPADVAPQITTTLSGSVGTISAYGETSPLNDRPHIMLSSSVTALRGGYRLGFEVISSTAGTVHVWADSNNLGLTSHDIDGWTEGDDLMSPAEIGGTGHELITVGAYVTRSDFTTENTGDMSLGETVGQLASFSCMGPTVDGRTKPEVAAPGCAIISSASSNYSSISSLPIAGYYEWNDRTYYYAYMQGTSMSAPFVTGVLATWLEAYPQLSPSDVRRILATTCVPADELSANGWGYGKIDAWAGIREAITMATGIEHVKAYSEAITIDPASGGLLCITAQDATSDVIISIYSLDGRPQRMLTIAADEARHGAIIAMGYMPAGAYIVKASTANHTATAKVSVR